MLKMPGTRKYRNKKLRFVRELLLWFFLLPASFALVWIWQYYSPSPALAVGPTLAHLIFYGDTDGAGIMRYQYQSAETTWGGEINGITGSASNILWTVAETAPTRKEFIIGSLRVNGELQIESFNGSTSTNQWANAGTSATQDCDTAPTSGTCVRAFDITHESLKGRAMVAYADNVGDKFYYALWDGSAWSPDSTPNTPSATNEVDFDTGGTGGTPHWIRTVPVGDMYDATRTNGIMVLIGDSSEDLYACYWDGSAFSCTASALETALQNCTFGQCFDGAWQDSDKFILTYYDGTATLKYQIYTVSTNSWGGEVADDSLSSSGIWMTSASDPTSTRIIVAASESGNDTESFVWRTDDATDGFTVCAASGTGCPDTASETVVGPLAAAAWEGAGRGEALYYYQNSGNGGLPMTWSAYTAPSTWTAIATSTGNTTDDVTNVILFGATVASPGYMMAARSDVACDLFTQNWSGTAWTAQSAAVETNLSNYGTACPGSGTPAGGQAISFDIARYHYSSWSRNWRFYSGTDTASVPTTALAAENTALTGFDRTAGKFRLRLQYAERVSGDVTTGQRKKLQYTSGCNPNVANQEVKCSWTDVDDQGGSGIWRYDQDADLACTATDCDDAVLLTGTVLTGTSASCTAGQGCGTWVEDKDSATVTNMTHTGSVTQESEYVVEANGAAGGTTYYFRIALANLGDVPFYREQDSDDCQPSGTSACTYPSLTTDNPVDVQMRHGNYFDSGTEQSFSWAN